MSHDADMIAGCLKSIRGSLDCFSHSVSDLTGQMRAYTAAFNRAFPCKCDLQIALDESLKLQAHYASILNNYDGGSRLIFTDSQQWIDRLKKIGTIKDPIPSAPDAAPSGQ